MLLFLYKERLFYFIGLAFFVPLSLKTQNFKLFSKQKLKGQPAQKKQCKVQKAGIERKRRVFYSEYVGKAIVANEISLQYLTPPMLFIDPTSSTESSENNNRQKMIEMLVIGKSR